MNDTGSLNLAWSQTLVAGFAAAGVRHAVLSPGSRSTPLALALLRQPGVECHVIIDERSAAFFALGAAKASRQAVMLLATSGTAPANWLPAVIEASQAGVPLILLTADRPPELHGCGANQTIDQLDLFGGHIRARHALGAPHPQFEPAWLQRLAAQVCEEAHWPLPGPVFINQPFREPLLPSSEVPAAPAVPPITLALASLPCSRAAIESVARKISGRPGAIVCGEAAYAPGFADAVTALAAQLNCPILAEPLSGLRFGPHDRSRILCRYEAWLRHAEIIQRQRPEWLLRFGTFPVTRALQGLMAGLVPAHILVEPRPRWSDPNHTVTDVVRADPVEFCTALAEMAPAAAPAGSWSTFAAADAAAQAALPVADSTWEGNLIPALLAALPPDCPLFVGNSMAIRDMDAFSGTGATPIAFFGNRGASGIDGNISTTVGIAAARGRAVALIGDLTCQHDLGGLAAAAGRNVVFVVVNNGGGGIFEYLPQAGLPEFEHAWLTPQEIDFAAAAATFGLGYGVADSLPEFLDLMQTALGAGRPALVEVRVDRTASVARRKAWLDAPIA